MKRLLLCCLLLLALTACGTVQTEPASAPAASEETWGVTAAAPAASPASEPAMASEPAPSPSPSSAPSPEPTPEPTPTPTPEPLYGSLTELCWPGPWVIADGVTLESLYTNEQVLVRAEDLVNTLSWLHWDDSAAHTLMLGTGETIPLELSHVNGEDLALARYDGGQGIFFDGKTQEEWISISWLLDRFDMRSSWEEDSNTWYITSKVYKDAIPWYDNVPVLMYHAVSDSPWGIDSLFVSPSDLRAQIEYLLAEGYEPIFFSDLPYLSRYNKPILLTFDDGYDDNYWNLFPILQEYNVKATCFIITGMLGDEHYMTADQAREMSDSGLVDIQSHTVSHTDLDFQTYEDQDYELRQSQRDVMFITGKIPYVICYPSGGRDGNTLDIAPKYYDFGLDMNGGMWNIQGQWYTVPRIYISRFLTLDEFIQRIQ